MTTKIKSSATSRKGRKVSENVNASEMMQVVNAAAAVTAPAGAGVGASGVSDGGALSSPAVGGGVRSSKGRSNSTSQLENAVNEETKAKADEEQRKEDTLYNKIVARFLAPSFDRNAFARPLLASGLDFVEIANRVNDARKEWKKNHPAPDCTVSLVLDACKDYEKDFVSLVGCRPDDIKADNVRVFSRLGGALSSRPIEMGASASAIVRAVLSWRWYIKEQDETKKRMRVYENNYRGGLRSAARGGLDIGKSKDQIMHDFEMYLNQEINRADSETALLRSNFNKVRARLDSAIKEIISLCPSVAVARLGVSDDVFIIPENITKEQKAVCGAQFAKVRNYRRQLTAINSALWGVPVVL